MVTEKTIEPHAPAMMAEQGKPTNEKTIIILGTGQSQKYCDFKCDEMWACNGAYAIQDRMKDTQKHYFKMSKLFATDYLWSTQGSMNFNIGILNRIVEEHKAQLILLHPFKFGKHKAKATQYPYKKIVEYFGENYFTDSITYMIAYALYKNSYLARNKDGIIKPELKHPLKIRLFGVDMVTTLEYQVSKGGVEHWLGIARGMGCGVEVAKGSAILAFPWGRPYGFRMSQAELKLYDPEGMLTQTHEDNETFDGIKEMKG